MRELRIEKLGEKLDRVSQQLLIGILNSSQHLGR
jgi:hypothetical protein